jgi:hypothetical protein
MLSLVRIDLSEILIAHVRTLRTLGKPGVNRGEVFFFFGLPAIIAAPLAYFFPDRIYAQAANLLTAVSIIGGFLFSVLAMTSQIVDKVKRESTSGSVRRIFAKEVHANVAFGIIASLACALSLIILGFIKNPVSTDKAGESVLVITRYLLGAAWLNYFLLCSFFLTLLMIVKRLFIILNSDAQEL